MKFANDSWSSTCEEYDKFVHMAGSCFFTVLLYALLALFFFWPVALLFSMVLSFVGGVAIEILQGTVKDFGDGFSWRDLVANIIGIIVAFVALV